jgi:hypothetical protein
VSSIHYLLRQHHYNLAKRIQMMPAALYYGVGFAFLPYITDAYRCGSSANLHGTTKGKHENP